jgi:hypothetical protein
MPCTSRPSNTKSLYFFETPEGIAFDEMWYSRRKETSNWSLLSTDLSRFWENLRQALVHIMLKHEPRQYLNNGSQMIQSTSKSSWLQSLEQDETFFKFRLNHLQLNSSNTTSPAQRLLNWLRLRRTPFYIHSHWMCCIMYWHSFSANGKLHFSWLSRVEIRQCWP